MRYRVTDYGRVKVQGRVGRLVPIEYDERKVYDRYLIVWKDDSRCWLYPKEIEMQLPKAIKVSSVEDAKLVVDVYNRALLFVIGEGESVRYVRLSPSGKEEDLTDKVRKAYALVSGSTPLKQGDMYGNAEASTRKGK